MKKLSAALAVILLLICIMPFLPAETALAADGVLSIDEGVQVGDNSNDNYMSGYMPQGAAGESVRVSLPLRNNDSNSIEKISVAPSIASDDAAFEPSNVICPLPATKDSKWRGTAVFDLRIKSSCYDGVYPASFTVSYTYDDEATQDVPAEQTFTVYVRVTGNPEPTPAPEPTAEHSAAAVSMPKLMVTSYTVTPEAAVAGEQIKLSVTIKNMSEKRYAQNIEIVLTSEDSTFLPENGTNSAYVSRLKAGEEISESFTFKVKPDAEAAPASITVSMTYEDSYITQGTASSVIAVPVNQPIRVRISDASAAGGMVTEPFSVTVDFINMGKSPLYNLAAEIKGDFYGQTSYYGGTVEAGGQKTIELSAYANSASEDPMQEFAGSVELSYEDSSSNVYTNSAPFVVSLQYYIEEPIIDEPVIEEEPQTGGGSLWIWIGIGVGVAAVVVVIILLTRRGKRRRKEIDDELL